MLDVRLLVDSQNQLGEGPLCNVQEQRLYRDGSSAAKSMNRRVDALDVTLCYVPSHAGLMALREMGGAGLAFANGSYAYDFHSRNRACIGDPAINIARIGCRTPFAARNHGGRKYCGMGQPQSSSFSNSCGVLR